MARAIAGPGAGFQGSVDDLSFYKMRGVEGTIVRRKGGPSRDQVKQLSTMELTRRNNSEFGGRAKTAQYIMRALYHHKSLADYNIAGPLNALMRPIQELDKEGTWGQRSVRLSTNPHILKGFSLNRNNPFDAAIRYPIEYVLNRNAVTAVVEIPHLRPGINFFAPEKYPWFSVIVSLGIVPDLVFTKNNVPVPKGYDSFTSAEARSSIHAYMPAHHDYSKLEITPPCIGTIWRPVKQGCPTTPLELRHAFVPPDDHFTLVLTIGIMYGIQQDAQTIEQARYAGAAKVLAVE